MIRENHKTIFKISFLDHKKQFLRFKICFLQSKKQFFCSENWVEFFPGKSLKTAFWKKKNVNVTKKQISAFCEEPKKNFKNREPVFERRKNGFEKKRLK